MRIRMVPILSSEVEPCVNGHPPGQLATHGVVGDPRAQEHGV